MKTLRALIALVVTLTTFAVAPASAGVVVYTDLAAFLAATSDEATHNFEGIAPAGSFVNTGVVVDGVTFSADGEAFVIDANAGYGHYGASFFSGQYPGSVTSWFGGISAIGFFYGSYTDSLKTGAVSLSTGDVFPLITPQILGVEVNFIGFVSDGDLLTFASFTSDTTVLDITQFVTARVSNVVPEPETLALVALALLGLGMARRRTAAG